MSTSQSSTLIGWVIVNRLFAIVQDTDTTGTVMVDMVRNGLTVRIFLKQTPDDDDLSIVCVLSRSVLYDSLWLHGLLPTKLLCPWDFPGKNIGVGCHALLQGIVPTQGLNPGLPHGRSILYHLNHQWSPK